jgi:hypothetical protein
MIQNLLDGHGIFNAGNDVHRPLALLAGFNVDIEYSFQPRGQGHLNVALAKSNYSDPFDCHRRD